MHTISTKTSSYISHEHNNYIKQCINDIEKNIRGSLHIIGKTDIPMPSETMKGTEIELDVYNKDDDYEYSIITIKVMSRLGNSGEIIHTKK